MTFKGTMVALVTPFKGGHVDWEALGRLVDFHLDAGTDGLVPCGTTGESPTLSHEEHDRVIEAVVKRADGRVPVIAGTGSNSTTEALRLTLHAKHAGADAAKESPPRRAGGGGSAAGRAADGSGGKVARDRRRRRGRRRGGGSSARKADKDS